jgi:taurine---2-oxoglutarate transaminase
MQGVRALCDKYGIMMISDEVMAGFGRTGEMFGFQNFEGVVPDMYTFAKGVSGSYIPLAGVGVD